MSTYAYDDKDELIAAFRAQQAADERLIDELESRIAALAEQRPAVVPEWKPLKTDKRTWPGDDAPETIWIRRPIDTELVRYYAGAGFEWAPRLSTAEAQS